MLFQIRFAWILILVSLLVSLGGCASNPSPWIHTYEGPLLPDNKVATFLHHFTNFNESLGIDQIQYTKTRDDPKTRFKPLPGPHVIWYSLRWYKRGFVQGIFRVNMKAEHVYILSHELRDGWLPRDEFVVVTLKDDTTNAIVMEKVFNWPS